MQFNWELFHHEYGGNSNAYLYNNVKEGAAINNKITAGIIVQIISIIVECTNFCPKKIKYLEVNNLIVWTSNQPTIIATTPKYISISLWNWIIFIIYDDAGVTKFQSPSCGPHDRQLKKKQ